MREVVGFEQCSAISCTRIPAIYIYSLPPLVQFFPPLVQFFPPPPRAVLVFLRATEHCKELPQPIRGSRGALKTDGSRLV